MFNKQIFLLAAIFGFAVAELPSYFPICGARNPKLDECVIKSVRALTDKLRTGIPDFDIPSSDPFYIENVIIVNMPNFKAVASQVKISGLTTYHINSLHVDLKKKEVVIDIVFAENNLNAICDINAKILVAIAGKGPISLTTKDVRAKVKLDFKTVERNGKTYLYFPTMSTQLDIKDYTLDFKADNFDKTLQDAVTQALGNSHKEVLEATKPNLEKAISEKCLEIANKICKHFTYDELFPDRE